MYYARPKQYFAEQMLFCPDCAVLFFPYPAVVHTDIAVAFVTVHASVFQRTLLVSAEFQNGIVHLVAVEVCAPETRDLCYRSISIITSLF